jgi:Signal transduction histidine kinase
LLSLLLIGGIVIYIFEDTYVKTVAKDAVLQENSYDVQTLINEYKFPNDEISELDFNNLKSMLSKYKYQLYLSDGHKRFYTNLYHGQFETLELIKQEISYSNKSKLYVWEDKSIITKNSSNISIIAIHESDGVFKLNRGTFEILILSFLIVGIGSILFIMLISRIFTLRLVNQIMIPIQKIIEGAGRIEKGNLEEPIIYEGEDEFVMVCNSFNKMQESLKAGIEKNTAYEKARTDMISGISHDLRTPLTSVKGYIKGVKDGVANTPEKQENYLNIAYKKACDMDVLLQKLFFFSKLETGNMPLYPVRTNLLSFMEEFIQNNEEYYKENNLFIHLNFQEQNIFVMIDAEQIRRVIDNILDNSIKYRIDDIVNVIIEIRRSNSFVTITIKDDGQGVPHEKLSHIFEQFYRADEARSGKKVGNGLGLYIIKYIVEQHGGWVAAKNQDGLMIEINLPLSNQS